MKTQLVIEFDSESEFESGTAKAHIEGPKLLNALCDYYNWLITVSARTADIDTHRQRFEDEIKKHKITVIAV